MAVETQLKGAEIVQAIAEMFDAQNTETENLREQLSQIVALRAEDLNWVKLIGEGGDAGAGPDLRQVKEWSHKMREALGNVHLQRGLRLRTNNIWSGGIHYNDDALPDGSGHKKQTRKAVNSPINRRNFFGARAHDERESALYTDGIYLVIGDPSDWSLTPVPLEQVGAVHLNPRRADEIIAYRIDITDYSESPEGVTTREWYYTDIAYEQRDKPGYSFAVPKDEVAPGVQVIFDLQVNTQVGWAFGVPDSLTAFAWAKLYRDFMVTGKIMSDAMAQFAYQIASGSKKETQNTAARIAMPTNPGGTLIGANPLIPLATAGRGYDFDSGRPLLAAVASALEVSVISLSSDPGTAGSSYGSASTLDLPTRLAMEARRRRHIDFDWRVLLWMGADPEKLDITFATLNDAADLYRELQALILALGTGLYEPEPIEERISQLLEITGNKVPDGWLLPAKTTPAATTPAPGQGQSNGTGGDGVGGHDIRTDNVS